jgi:septal ring factor EnvC (AmiA/AmiB activator)
MIRGIVLPLAKTFIIPALAILCFSRGIPEALSHPGSREKQEQIDQIESQLSRQKSELKAIDSREKDLLAGLSVLEQEVEEKRRFIEEQKEKIGLGVMEVKGLQKKLNELRNASSEAEAGLAKRLITLYKNARKGYIKLITDVRDMDQFWQRMKYLKAIIMEDRRELTRLAEAAREQQDQVARAEKTVLDKEGMIDKEKSRLSSLKKELEKETIRLMKLHKEKEFYETAVKELQLAAKDLRQALSEAEKKEPHRVGQSSRFQDSKGTLPLPLRGEIVRGSTFLSPSRLNLHQGIFIEGTSDFDVRAIFAGRVDFSGRLTGYGEVIIINHGSRFFTVSALLSKRGKKEGDVVTSREVIGEAGSNGSSRGGRLYFEIRMGGENLDPLSWLKVR